jgi:CubicO group peptidase (beta-lactamase class C family)
LVDLQRIRCGVIALLAERGSLARRRRRKYIPELPRYDATITLRQLLHHTSGFVIC